MSTSNVGAGVPAARRYQHPYHSPEHADEPPPCFYCGGLESRPLRRSTDPQHCGVQVFCSDGCARDWALTQVRESELTFCDACGHWSDLEGFCDICDQIFVLCVPLDSDPAEIGGDA